MKLFLSGGGSGERSKLIDTTFMNNIDKTKPVLYVPLARKPPYSSCLDWICSNFKPFNFSNFKMIESFEELKKTRLSDYSGIYIGGGNTFQLLRGLKDSSNLESLKKYILNGGIIYGGSAGAIILGKDIGTSSDMNEVGLKSNNALNLIRDLSIFCHYNLKDDPEIKKYIKKNKISVLALPENSGIKYENEKIEAIGPGSLFLFNSSKKREITPGTIF